MAQDRDQYVQFTIKLLRGSFALNALWQDALNYHMIDQPEKLIALRLTEYYEMKSQGVSRPGPGMQAMPATPAPPASTNNGHTPQPPTRSGAHFVSEQQPTEAIRMPGQQRSQPLENRPSKAGSDVVSSSSAQVVEQNAEEAADYWSPL